nr:GNAT family N-acetyltransferase [Pseudonocardia sp. N23]
MAYSVLRRLATTEHPVTGGTAVLTAAVSASHQHNQLLIDGPVGAAQVISDAEHVLGGAGIPHRAATLRGVDAAATAAELARHGWEIDHLVSLVTTPSGEPPRHQVRAERALPSELRPFWEASWLRAAPGLTEEQRAQLSDRHELEDGTVDVHAMAIREHGLVVACCLLKIDGSTAELDAVETAPTPRGRGLGDALLAGALRQAHQAGCDLVWLDADAADWPRDWYRRRGFGQVGESWFCRLRG